MTITTPITSPTDRHAAIRELEIASPTQAHVARDLHLAAPPDPSEISKPQGFVDKGSVVAFVAGVSPQAKSDVLNSTLLAQLAADKKFDRDTDVMNWYGQYTKVLSAVGWALQGSSWSHYQSSETSFTMDKAVLEIAAAALTGPEGAVIEASLAAMKSLPEKDGRLQLFDQSSSSGTDGNFQISACSETDGAVAMSTMAFFYSSAQQSTTVLFFNFSTASTQLQKSVQAATLDEDVYATVRSTVLDKLGANAKNFVLDLDI